MSYSSSPPAPAQIQCIAILGPRNTPIYARQFHHHSRTSTSPSKTSASSSDTDLKYHYFAHAGLDVIDERTAPGKNVEQYLGLLYTLEDLAVYGFQTSTRVKFLLMISLTDHLIRDIDILTIFRALHTSYLSYSSNPFHNLPPNPSSLLASPSPSSSSTSIEGARSAFLAIQDSTLPIKARQIRSPAFDRAVDRIAGIRHEASGSTAGGASTTQSVAAVS